MQRKFARAKRGSNRRARLRALIARLRAREAARRRDWLEKTTTRLAIGFDLIAVEDLNGRAMTRSAKGTIDAPGHLTGTWQATDLAHGQPTSGTWTAVWTDGGGGTQP